MKVLLPLAFFVLILTACQTGENAPSAADYGNPPAEGFRLEDSDPEAIAIADAVMQAMGGRQSWDTTRYLQWDFFGRRTLLWDKTGQRVRIDIPADSTVMIVDLENKTGKVWLGGTDISTTDSVGKYLERAESIWINDSYWLAMPYKMKDSGVTLKYLGQDSTQAGAVADVLQLTFEAVGRTPQNRYRVYVDPDSRMVVQWDYFRDATDSVPGMSTPWMEYRQYGDLQFSSDRGRARLDNIAVFQTVPETFFTDFRRPTL